MGRQPGLSQNAGDDVVMDAELAGDRAAPPLLNMGVAQDLGVQFGGYGHGRARIVMRGLRQGRCAQALRLVVRRDRPAQLLAYSPLASGALKALAGDFSDPKAYGGLGLDQLANKPMPTFARRRRLAACRT